MKTRTLILAAVLAFAFSAGAAEPKTGLIRDTGVFLTDTNGSQVELSKVADSRFALSVTQVVGKSRDTTTVPKFSKQIGWFVYIESPMRVWTFDGKLQLDVITSDGRHAVTAPGVFDTCPQAVWDAVPESARKFLHDKRAA